MFKRNKKLSDGHLFQEKIGYLTLQLMRLAYLTLKLKILSTYPQVEFLLLI